MLIWHGDKVEREVDKFNRDNLYKAALMVEADAKRLCPVDTGRLRSSITHNVDEGKLKAQVTAGGKYYDGSPLKKGASGGTNVKYAVYVELGTYKMAAQPYLRPALANNKAKIRRLWGK